MYKVAFKGGSTSVEMGSSGAMMAFFSLIERNVADVPDVRWGLVTDRLYRRYVRKEDVESTRVALESAQEHLSQVPACLVRELLGEEDLLAGGLNLDAESMSDLFGRYFSAIWDCMHSAAVNEAKFGSDPDYEYRYEPVMILRSEMPAYFIDRQIPLAAYDGLKGDPLWIDTRRPVNLSP